MPSSIFGQKENGNSIIKMLRHPDEAAALFRNANAKCTLPNGQQVGIDEFAKMMSGKSPDQAFSENGKDFSQFRNFNRR